jgi:hypothetical protein
MNTDKSARTPGEWFVYDDDTSDELAITADARDGKVPIATVSIGFDEPFDSEQRANAQLLAAAPALFEALEDCLRVLHPQTAEYESAEAALALAGVSRG